MGYEDFVCMSVSPFAQPRPRLGAPSDLCSTLSFSQAFSCLRRTRPTP